ncbi:MAG TPA: N-acetyltransferase [Thermoanaerobaculia bacterium]|nr:N-acetyltransferase [Thermoanaerobaculia bacterium]
MIEIRAMSPADAPLCARLMSTSEPWTLIGRTYEESLALVTDPSKEAWVAYDGDRFLGFILLILRGAFVGYIQIIAVSPEARSTGVGSQLIEFAERRIFSEFPNVFLCVSSFNPRARALYERHGFELVGELKDYLVHGASEFLMRKTIGPLRP